MMKDADTPRRRLVQLIKQLAAGGIPEANGSVASSGRHQAAVRRERDALHLARVAGQDPQLGPVFDVPQPDDSILAARDQCLAIRREGGGPANALSSLELAHFRILVGVPQMHDA